MNFNCTAAIISEIGSIDDSWRFTSKIGSDSVMVSEYSLSNGSSKMSIQCNSYNDPKSKETKTELLVRNIKHQLTIMSLCTHSTYFNFFSF